MTTWVQHTLSSCHNYFIVSEFSKYFPRLIPSKDKAGPATHPIDSWITIAIDLQSFNTSYLLAALCTNRTSQTEDNSPMYSSEEQSDPCIEQILMGMVEPGEMFGCELTTDYDNILWYGVWVFCDSVARTRETEETSRFEVGRNRPLPCVILKGHLAIDHTLQCFPFKCLAFISFLRRQDRIAASGLEWHLVMRGIDRDVKCEKFTQTLTSLFGDILYYPPRDACMSIQCQGSQQRWWVL